MRELGFELAIGDWVQIADQVLTVIDIHGEEITFRLDRADDCEPSLTPNADGPRAAPATDSALEPPLRGSDRAAKGCRDG